MTMPKLTLVLMLYTFCSAPSTAQTTNFTKYTDTVHQFSFDIPSYWTIKYSKEQQGMICVPTTKSEKDIYGNCFEGIVFRMDFGQYGLDTLLFQQFDKIGDNYVTSDRVTHDVPVRFIKGSNWKGIRHDNTCGISCNDNGFHAAAGECQFFYFCKGNKTVGIQTNGRALDEKVIARLISSFKFNE
ncbi:MAG: hypothetical protein EOO46_25350 [Flavobacterium sp.]|nr:MAG: hypothetical protein EOO46_25350 [Flavobacterium sp.]